MAWLSSNWIWILLGAAFLAFHLFGHGAHGGHNGQAMKEPSAEAQEGEAGANANAAGQDAPHGHDRHGG